MRTSDRSRRPVPAFQLPSPRKTREGKRVLDVRVSARRGQARLRRPAGAPPQRAHDGQSEVARQIVGLVEAAVEPSPGMQGHGNHAVSIAQQVGARGPHHGRERRGEDPSPFVLERVDDLPQRSVVPAGAPRGLQHGRLAPAARTERVRRAARRPARRRSVRSRAASGEAPRPSTRRRRGPTTAGRAAPRTPHTPARA